LSDTKLHVVIVYHAAENTYVVSAHNQPPDKAKAFADGFNPETRPGAQLITVEQQRTHKTEDEQTCRACRETVQRSSGLQPLPKFIRRKQ
jgi:hypothetical protein